MTIDEFWKIIDDVNAECGADMDEKVPVLTERLEAMPAQQVLEFARIFESMMNQAYTWDLWGAAYVIHSGCTDDAFIEFRSSLISMGRDVFEKAVADPESLAGLPPAIVESLGFEGFGFPADSVYQDKTGSLPDHQYADPLEPKGEPWTEDEATLKARYPKLWQEFAMISEKIAAMEKEAKKSRPWWKLGRHSFR